MKSNVTTILFGGYAPVHFICFQPLYERLRQESNIRILLTGGLRTAEGDGYHYDLQGLYGQFDVDTSHLVSIPEADKLEVDILISSSTQLLTSCKYGTSIQIFHGNSFRNRAIRQENACYDYYFMLGPYMMRSFTESGFLEASGAEALEIGFMKTDKMINGELNTAAVQRSFGFDGSRPVLLYAPTGQKYNSLETMGVKVVRNICESNRFDLIVKLHDHPKNDPSTWMEELKRYSSPHCNITEEKDVAKCLFAADLLITDASSVSSEYSLLDRPMVFLDVPKLIRKAAAKEGAKVDLDTWGRRAGEIVYKSSDAVEVITRSLDQHSDKADIRTAMARDLYYNHGEATNAAMTAIGNIIARHGQTAKKAVGSSAC